MLRDLASLPGEDRAARLQEVVQEMAAAWPVLSAQATHLLQIARSTLAQVAAVMGGSEFRSAWLAAAGQSPPPLPLDLLLSALARQEGLDSQKAFAARLESDPAFRVQVEELARLVGGEATAPYVGPAATQALADRLIAWIQTPDWGQSQAFLAEYAVELLSNEAEQVLALLQENNSQNRAIPQHLALLERCREIGVEAAYAELQAAIDVEQDSSAQALLAALRTVGSAEELARVMEEHPLLGERPALERLAGAVVQAQAAGETEFTERLLVLLGPLLDIYNRSHAEAIEPEEQEWFITLHERLLAAGDALEIPDITVVLNQSLGWALNTLGNYYAQAGDPKEAVTAYSRALSTAPENAMLYRNRAGEYIELGEFDRAKTDIEAAAGLEPDAVRLPQLWCDLFLGQGDGAAMLPHAQLLCTRQPDAADHHFYLALAQVLVGDETAAVAAMKGFAKRAQGIQRERGRKRLARLQEQLPERAEGWQALDVLLTPNH